MKITYDPRVDGGKVTDAWSSSTMFRGMKWKALRLRECRVGFVAGFPTLVGEMSEGLEIRLTAKNIGVEWRGTPLQIFF